MPALTPFAALVAAVRADPATPLVTYVGPEGRTELSARSLENAAAKAAGLLRDGLDVQPGDVVALLLDTHWQTSVWLAACWATGALAWMDPTDFGDVAVALATGPRLDEIHGVPELLRVSTHPFGLPSDQPLPGRAVEAAVEVRAYGDVFVPYAEPRPLDPALRVGPSTLTGAEVMDQGAALAARIGLDAGGRLLTTRPATDLFGVLALLAAPLAVAGSVVIAVEEDPERVRATENTTATLT
ncbi:MAG: TIGR03089 family protein [Candidatus Nanopelagicales bacterium]